MNATGRRGGMNPLVAGFVTGVILVAVLALLAKINVDLAAPWSPTHTVRAEVADVDGLGVSSDVRIAGRIVGQVTGVAADGTHSTVTFHVDSADWPLPADTTASIRLATLLGQKYVQLVPGSSQTAMADDAVIPLQSTRPVVDFDQILDTFDKHTRDSLTSLIRTVSAGVAGQEDTIQRLIPNLADLSQHSVIPTQELATRDPEFNAILTNLGVTAAQLDQSREDLAGVIDHTNAVTAALAAGQGRALTSFITQTDALNVTTNAVLGGGTAAALDSGLSRLGGFVSTLDQLMRTLIPQTSTFSQPLAVAEPSDRVNGNNAVPAKSGIDLIYEVTQATSQGYGSTNFGSASSPNFQGNFFLRQNIQGFEACFQNTPPCTWGQTGTSGAIGPAPASAPASTPPASPSPGSTPSPVATPAPSPTPAPSASPSPSPGASPSPSATPAPAPDGPGPPSPGAVPTASPSPGATTAAALTAPSDPAVLTALEIAATWDALFGGAV